jgi:hypothetical protein
VYSKFRKKKNSEKSEISNLHGNARFYTSKCRGKLQKVFKKNKNFNSITLSKCRPAAGLFKGKRRQNFCHPTVHHNGAKAQNCVVQKFCAKGGQSLLSLPGTMEFFFFLHFKLYNLTICAVDFFETFCTCSPSSLGHDPTVKSLKKLKKFRLGFLS